MNRPNDYKPPPRMDACRVLKAQVFLIVEAITLHGVTRTRCAVHSPEGELMAFVDADEHDAVTKGMQLLAGYLAGRMQWPSSDAVRLLLDASGRQRR